MYISLRKKIILLVLSLLFILTIAASVISTLELQKYYKQRIIKQMTFQLDEVEFLLATLNLNFDDSQYYDYFTNYAIRAQYRLTLVDSTGLVVFDSNVPMDSLALLQNHLNRPEVQMALRQRLGRDERISATLASPMLYTAKVCNIPGIRFIRLALPLDEIRMVMNTVSLKILVGSGVAFFIMAVVSYFIAIRITYPIQQISKVAEKIKGGDYNARFAVVSSDEIGDLAELLNEMLDKINDDLVRMKKLERMRSQFLGNVSHELRTPIFSVQGYLETILQNPRAHPEKQRKFIKKAYRQAVRLNNLLTDLIDISRIESGEMKMTFEPFNVHSWLQKIVAEQSETAAEHKVTISLANKNNEQLQVLGDRHRLTQAVLNLVTNAIKYNVENGTVQLGYHIKKDVVEIYISDTGRGIEAKHIPRIFERFYRVDKERSRKVGGTGLGLAIVKHIIEAHHGAVSVESEIGIGTRISFKLHKTS